MNIAATTLAAAIEAGEPINRTLMNTAMEAAFGDTNSNGAWSQRDSFDALEAAVARTLPATLNPSLPSSQASSPGDSP